MVKGSEQVAERSEERFSSHRFRSPVGWVTLCCNGAELCGLWLEGQRYFGSTMPAGTVEVEGDASEAIGQALAWLDAYFAGKRPAIAELPLAPAGSGFRQLVWERLKEIPYGEVATYGEIAQDIAKAQGKERTAPIAVGGAVGHNPISIIVPCHRVVGADGSLTGYAGGLDKKLWPLEHEGVDTSKLYRPKRGPAL